MPLIETPLPFRSASGTRPHHVLVTGHTGFVGSRLTRRLRDAGVRVTGVSRSEGFDILTDQLPLENVDHVYHTAGLTYVPKAWSDPVQFHLANAHGTVRVLDQCRRSGVPMTYLSTYVYGPPPWLPIAESLPARPNNPYAFSKLAGEVAVQYFADDYGLNVHVLRIFNVYGPGQGPDFLIPTILRQALDPGVPEIVVADLAPRRDYVHIDDVVEALLLAPGLPEGAIANVGSGYSLSVGEVIATCLACAGTTKPYRERGERRPNEILDVVADVSLIERLCGWRPRISFEDGIQSILKAGNP